MREIKFRAWDKRRGGFMFYPAYLDFNKSGTAKEIIGHEPHHGDPEKLSNKSIILMQYTGLKDKNGKEIYEGDICKVNTLVGLPEEERIITVEYVKTAFQDSDLTWRLENWHFIEIVGNIHQNKELIHGKKKK